MSLTLTTNQSFRTTQAERPALRLMLYDREVYRLPEPYARIDVVSGEAWVTIGGDDIVLITGESLALGDQRHGVVISALRGGALVVELR